MKIEFSQSFIKATKKLSGKNLELIREMIASVKNASKIEDIPNCKKLTNYKKTYRIRVGSLRAFFILYLTGDSEIVKFEYLKPRGEAYKKDIVGKLQKKDK